MTKGEIAKNNFMQGYNCAQAVLLAFVTIWDLMNRLLLCWRHRLAAE